ncbi:hypothetical protein DFJ77DRAFT_67694 [Powellomyces hirtus]|nr:hypothetical protein DFJ77DRAFT_67694 [Powellomyces hirtus]
MSKPAYFISTPSHSQINPPLKNSSPGAGLDLNHSESMMNMNHAGSPERRPHVPPAAMDGNQQLPPYYTNQLQRLQGPVMHGPQGGMGNGPPPQQMHRENYDGMGPSRFGYPPQNQPFDAPSGVQGMSNQPGQFYIDRNRDPSLERNHSGYPQHPRPGPAHPMHMQSGGPRPYVPQEPYGPGYGPGHGPRPRGNPRGPPFHDGPRPAPHHQIGNFSRPPHDMGPGEARYDPANPSFDGPPHLPGRHGHPNDFGNRGAGRPGFGRGGGQHGNNGPHGHNGPHGGGPIMDGPRPGSGPNRFRQSPGGKFDHSGPPNHNNRQGGGGGGPGGPNPFRASNGPSPGPPPHSHPLPHSRREPPPTATFDYHPVHWVAFAAPSNVISAMPPSSRLFMGNLASERTDKTELARIFAPYGNIAEIVLKGSFGFVQFDNPDACQRAMQHESGRKVAGMSMDLKISREKRKEGGDQQRRGGGSDRRHDGDHVGPTKRRDEDRRGRSDDRDRRRSGGRDRSSSFSSSDSEDDHRRRRDDNRGSRGGNRNRRSLSPQRPSSAKASKWGPEGDGKLGANIAPSSSGPANSYKNVPLPNPTISAAPVGSGVYPLPLRMVPNVPECQIIVLTEMDRNYVNQVEYTVRNAGIKVDVMSLDQGTPLRDLVSQMIAEGVRGVVFLERRHAVSKTASMQIFQLGNTVAEYENINPEIAALLFLRDRSVRPIVQPLVSGVAAAHPALGQQQPQQQAGVTPAVLASLLGGQLGGLQQQLPQGGAGGLDAQTLLTLVTALHQQQQQQQQQQLAQLTQSLGGGAAGANTLAALGLGGLAGLVQQPQGAPNAAQPQQQNLASMLQSLLSGSQGQMAAPVLPLQQRQQQQPLPQQQSLQQNTPQQQQRQQLLAPGGGVQNVQPNAGLQRFSQSQAQQQQPQSGQEPQQQQQQQQPGTNNSESVADLLNRLKSLQHLHPGGGPGVRS